MKNLLIADDHLIFGNAMQYLLKQLDQTIETTPVGSVAGVIEVLDAGKSFDLILLDYMMPQMDGLEGLALIMQSYPNSKIGIISGHTDARLVRKALDAGSIGWIPKTISEEPLLHALRLMASGERFIPVDMIDELTERAAAADIFTNRERDVADLIAEGITDKEISNRLAMSPGTVSVHLRSLYKKTGTDNRTKLAIIYRDKY
ncbi:MAG: response regulator transcription factor [Emcibacter sp.]|nr:response regulator transcription factor [Emcibacter sp.]